jgi:hypothetical protein
VGEVLAGALLLFLIAGGGIVLIDALIIRRLRRSRDSTKDDT